MGSGACPAFRTQRRRWWQVSAAAALIVAVAWTSGLAWFALLAERTVPLPPLTDGIVALTGGAARIETALHLLADGRGGKLLISGIGGGNDLPGLAHRAGLDPAPLAERVTLGRQAASTRGNAIETARWASGNNIQSLTVVTAYYHMPRALTELHRAMPNVRLFALPVLKSNGNEPKPHPTMRLLIEEYNKYLVAASGLSAWLPAREARAEPRRDGPRDTPRDTARSGPGT